MRAPASRILLKSPSAVAVSISTRAESAHLSRPAMVWALAVVAVRAKAKQRVAFIVCSLRHGAGIQVQRFDRMRPIERIWQIARSATSGRTFEPGCQPYGVAVRETP